MLEKNPIIHLKAVNKIFKVKSQDVWVLKNIDLEIYPGEFVVVFGPSGSGKSTILHVMLGLEPPTVGDAKILGLEIYLKGENELCDYRKKFVGIIYQQPNWVKSLSVIENVAFPLVLQGEKREDARVEAMEMLKVVGMTEWADYHPSELSSGQQQKISLARAFITDPQIIVADEPTGNLDVNSGDAVIKLFREQADKGKSIIMVSHNLDNLDTADRIVQVLDGQIIAEHKVTKENIAEIKKKITEKVDPTILQNRNVLDEAQLNKLKPVKEKKRFKFLKALARSPRLIPTFIKFYVKYTIKAVKTTLILTLYLIETVVDKTLMLRPLRRFDTKQFRMKFGNRVRRLTDIIQAGNEGTVSFYDLVDLSVRNLFSKKARTWITIGGVSIGIAFIVFLVSVGYGLENLVISRVARLEELKQLEATPAVSSNIYITDETIAQMTEIQGVRQVLPIINVAARVNYQNSSTDAVAFGAQSDYLKESAIKPKYGEVYDNNLLVNPVGEQVEEDTTGRDVSDVEVSLVEELTTEIARQAAEEDTASGGEAITQVVLPDKHRVADVNEAFLRVIGLDPTQAVGKTISVTFVVTGQLAPGQQKVETLPVEYNIIGVIPEGDTSLVYVPIIDLKEIGIERYSLMKIVAENEDILLDVRRNIEASGFRTSAVIDTVVQIEQLFVTVRLAFGIVGVIALSVAALGMFNTLTVSLLERTHEVGLMKAIGMKPDEVEDLFIAESVSMGFLGGLLGLTLGLGFGKIISLLLSIYAISKGYEGIDVTYLPAIFIVLVIFLSALVGLLTGYFPAKRSTEISAINALRYE